jgi:hypothetical protein
MGKKIRRFFVEVKSYGCEQDLDELRKDTGNLSRSLAAAGFMSLAVYEPERIEVRGLSEGGTHKARLLHEVIERTYEKPDETDLDPPKLYEVIERTYEVPGDQNEEDADEDADA